MKRQILSITMLLAVFTNFTIRSMNAPVFAVLFEAAVHISSRYLIKKYRLRGCKGELETIKRLIEYGYLEDINKAKLFWACDSGNLAIVKLLLPHCTKETINKADKYGTTPLRGACCGGNLAIVELLLPRCTKETINKANNNDGITPLFWACWKDNKEIVKLLLPHCTKATINKVTAYGDTPLCWACRKGYTEIVELLLLNGATVRQKDLDKAKDQATKDYLQAVLEYDALEKNKPQNKVAFICSKRGEQGMFNFLIQLSLSRSIEEVIKNQKHLKDTVFCKLCDQLYDKKVLDGAIKEAQRKIYRSDMKEMAVRFKKTIKNQLTNQLIENKNYLNVRITTGKGSMLISL
ncbi:ankyrin repeat domain-containing protein [Candidatus Dependentiae bacterium]